MLLEYKPLKKGSPGILWQSDASKSLWVCDLKDHHRRIYPQTFSNSNQKFPLIARRDFADITHWFLSRLNLHGKGRKMSNDYVISGRDACFKLVFMKFPFKKLPAIRWFVIATHSSHYWCRISKQFCETMSDYVINKDFRCSKSETRTWSRK